MASIRESVVFHLQEKLSNVTVHRLNPMKTTKQGYFAYHLIYISAFCLI